jgi:hypothetical protein
MHPISFLLLFIGLSTTEYDYWVKYLAFLLARGFSKDITASGVVRIGYEGQEIFYDDQLVEEIKQSHKSKRDATSKDIRKSGGKATKKGYDYNFNYYSFV